MQRLIDEDDNSNVSSKENQDLTVPPGFKPLSSHQQLNKSPQDSQSTDEGIDRDIGSGSIFQSARSDNEVESVYLECHEDTTIINKPHSTMNSNLEWRNQKYRSHWNSNKVKYQSNYNKHQLKKPVNPNKAPLSADKKKNSMTMKNG